METRSLEAATAFTTKDGSMIRELFGLRTGGTVLQSLAESRLPAGGSTQRHYHAVTEEIYFILAGRADMELDGAHAELGPGEAVARSWRSAMASSASCVAARPPIATRTPISSSRSRTGDTIPP
jgi:uncharacterized cupin superfamily protein